MLLQPSNTLSRPFETKSKPTDVRLSNITAGKALASLLRTSLGPRGMDKMIQNLDQKGKTASLLISNDGATILKSLNLLHPCSKMLVGLAEAQDGEAGDGTTTVVVMAGALLGAAETLLQAGLHASSIAEGFKEACEYGRGVLEGITEAVNLEDRATLISAASTSLNSKVNWILIRLWHRMGR